MGRWWWWWWGGGGGSPFAQDDDVATSVLRSEPHLDCRKVLKSHLEASNVGKGDGQCWVLCERGRGQI